MRARTARDNLERCFDQCASRAWRLAFSMLRDRDEAFDAVQQAFLVASSKVERVPADEPWPWFSAVVVNECRNFRRKKRPQPVGSWPGEQEGAITVSNSPEQAMLDRETHDEIWSALDELPAKEREAVVLTHVAGFTHAGAARSLGVPRQTLTSAVNRGLERLKRLLGDRGQPLPQQLALLPVVDPPGGWTAAMATWKTTATAAVTTSSVVSGSIGWGGIGLMSTKWIWIAGVSVALGLSFWGGRESALVGVERRTAADSSDTATSEPPMASTSYDDAKVAELSEKLERGQRRVEELQEALTKEQAKRAELETALAATGTTTGTSGPLFTFGLGGQLDAIHEANWPELAASSRIVSDGVHQLLEFSEAGEKPPQDLLLAIQEHAERMRKYEYRTIGKLPSDAKHNGEFTHPITMTNMLAEILASGGAPLSEGQVRRIEQLGVDFDVEFEKQRSRYPEGTLRVRRMLDEYLLKGAFVEDLHRLLTNDQRALAIDEETYRIAALDLYCPTLMIIHTSPVITGASKEEIADKTAGLIANQFKIDADEVRPLLTAWQDATESLLDPVSSLRARHYSYEDGIVAGRATIELYELLLDRLSLSDEARAAIMEAYAFYVPRVVADSGAG